MQNNLKTVIGLDDFADYFGPSGVITVMAWWLID